LPHLLKHAAGELISSIIVLVMSATEVVDPIICNAGNYAKIAVFTVNYWGIQGIYDIFWKLVPLTDITFLSRVFVLLCIGNLF